MADELSPDLLTELWRRAGISPDRLRGDGRLAALFDAWCRVVPYDTATKVDRLRGTEQLWGLDADEVVVHAFETGLGATCFPLASAFAATARADGFDATVHAANPLGRGGPAEHAVCVVGSGGLRWLCDPAVVHRVPASIPPVDGSQWRVGPPWSPLWVSKLDGEVCFTVERGTSTERRTYLLGEPLDRDGIAAAYDVAGRWATGLELYMRRACPDRQVVASSRTVTTKDHTGLTRTVHDAAAFEGWLRSVGVTATGLEVVRRALDAIEAGADR